MKPNELRIGNFVQTKTSEYSYKVKALGEIMVDLSGTSVIYEHCVPIPLTEEWLKTFGFSDIGILKIRNEMIIDCVIDLNNKSSVFIDIAMRPIILEHIKYVHQLQNLYFALTGKELEIK